MSGAAQKKANLGDKSDNSVNFYGAGSFVDHNQEMLIRTSRDSEGISLLLTNFLFELNSDLIIFTGVWISLPVPLLRPTPY